jgi:alpha-beta hydrolase superfamily lysophospholipase
MAPTLERNTAAAGAQVVQCAEGFLPDEIAGFEQATLSIPAEDDGELCATLVRTVGPNQDPRPAVLYVHGFVDYFFHTHVAEAFEQAGFRFYALDLRRYGRSLREKNRACGAQTVDDYFFELDWAVATIRAQHGTLSGIIAHSTGGLIASLYLDARRGQGVTQALVLNSPFLQFNFSRWHLAQAWLVVKLAKIAPHLALPHKINAVYGKTIHRSEGGEWDYDLKKKPIQGFTLVTGWFRMIAVAHRRVRKGLSVDVPILCMHSARSHMPGTSPVDADRREDIVLNVEHIKALSRKLGPRVTLFEVPDGIHDLTLSCREARGLAINKMVQFIAETTKAASRQ